MAWANTPCTGKIMDKKTTPLGVLSGTREACKAADARQQGNALH